MGFSLKLTDDFDWIKKQILYALADSIDDALTQASQGIRKGISNLLLTTLQNSPEYLSLKADRGDLRLELGIDDRTKVDEIIQIWANSVIVSKTNIVFSANKLKGGLTINAVKSDYSDVLSSINAFQRTAKGEMLPWLDWLLLQGGKLIIRDYSVVFGSSRYSRTGYAIMRKNTNGFKIVPPSYRGGRTDNWITRAIDTINEDDIVFIVQNNIEKYL